MKIRTLQVEFDASSQVRDEADAVVVPAVLARECVSNYCSGRGYKPWAELKAAAFTLDGAWVVAFKHIDSVHVNDREDIRGKVANVRCDEAVHSVLGDIRFLKGNCDQALLDKAKQGLLSKDVSAAYFDDEVPELGKFGEDVYDFVQRNLMFGHVAVGIPEGRCPSPFCGMSMDSFDSFLRVTVRDPALFTCRLTTVLMNAKDGVYALVGKLRKNLGVSGWAEGDAVVRDFLFDASKGWTPEKAEAWATEHRDEADAAWSTDYVNNLADECFAYIEPGGTKDSEGKTVPRDLRHLEYKNAEGQIDYGHLVAALAALGGAHTGHPPSYAAEAKGKLCAAVRSWNREHSDAKIQSAICGTDSQGDCCVLDSVDVLARSRELLGNMPKGRQSVMTNAGWGVRHHDGAL